MLNTTRPGIRATTLGFAALVLAGAAAVASGQEWYDAAWGRRLAIEIDNAANPAVLTGYPVKIALSSAGFDFGLAGTAGQDVRVTAADGVTPLPFWIEEWDAAGATATVWARVDSIPGAGTTAVYLYHDNPAAAAAGDGDATFAFFDDFSHLSDPGLGGNWRRVVVATGFDGAHNVLVHDVDADGRADLVADAYRAGHVVWYRQPADPVADPWTRYDIDLDLPNVHDSRIGDINGDGRKDIVSLSLSEDPFDYNVGNGSLVWYKRLSDPTGTWTKTVIASSGASGLLGGRSLALGDLDGDDDLDVVVAVDADTYQTTGRVFWYRNPGGSASLDPAQWTEYLIDDTPGCGSGVQIGDVDGDGEPDIVYSAFQEGHPGDSTFVYFAPPDPTDIPGWQRVAVAPSSYRTDLVDFDGDGDRDILRAGFYGDEEVAWHENPGPAAARDGSAWTRYVIERSASTLKTNRLWAGDIDGDGDLDIAMCSDPSGSTGFFKWYRRPADPREVAQYEIYTIDGDGTYTGWAHDCFLADIDGDDDLDLAGVGCNANTVLWWVNDPQPTPALDPAKWSNGGGEPAISDGVLTISVAPNQYVQTTSTFQYKAFRTSARFAQYATNGNLGFKSDLRWVGFNDVTYCCSAPATMQSITAADTTWTWGYSLDEGTGWKVWEALWQPGEARFVVDGELRQVHTTTIPTIPLPFVVNTNTGSPVIDLDWVVVRDYSPPEPTATPGQAQTVTAVDGPPRRAEGPRIDAISPNPFNPGTEIGFTLPAAGMVSLRVYDMRGRLVRTLVAGELPAGRHVMAWDGSDGQGRAVASGLYLSRLRAGPGADVRLMTLLK